jgi:hypothetical protein
MRVLRTLWYWSVIGGSLLAAPLVATGQSASSTDGLRSGALFDSLARMDSVLFDASFVSCAPATANAIFSDDVEFYHDVQGLEVGDQVRESTRRLTASCPRGHGVRRVLIPGSLRVYPIAGYGAVQMGTHRFDETGSRTSTLTRFVHVWKREHDTWRLARVLSLDHHAIPAPKAAARASRRRHE